MPVDASIPLQVQQPNFMSYKDMMQMKYQQEQNQMAMFQFQQQQQQYQQQNQVRNLLAQPGMMGPNGMPTPQAINAMAGIDANMASQWAQRLNEAQSTQALIEDRKQIAAKEAQAARVERLTPISLDVDQKYDSLGDDKTLSPDQRVMKVTEYRNQEVDAQVRSGAITKEDGDFVKAQKYNPYGLKQQLKKMGYEVKGLEPKTGVVATVEQAKDALQRGTITQEQYDAIVGKETGATADKAEKERERHDLAMENVSATREDRLAAAIKGQTQGWEIKEGIDEKTGKPLFYRINKATGESIPVTGAVPTRKLAQASESERKAAMNYTSMKNANDVLEEYAKKGADKLAFLATVTEDDNGIFHAAGRFGMQRALTPDEQVVAQAAKQFAEGAGHLKAGARINHEVMNIMRDIYLPGPADSPEVIARKDAARRNDIAAGRVGGGRAVEALEEAEKADKESKGGSKELSDKDKKAIAWAKAHPKDPYSAQILALHPGVQ